jgi:hypothetical protein
MEMLRLIIKTLLYGWMDALDELLDTTCKLLRRWWDRQGQGKISSPHDCVPINEPAFVRPDPLIYDQYYLDSLGLAVTWDNPDIQLYLNGAPVSSAQLEPATTYEVAAQIWNNSTDAPVVNMPVAFSFLEFGVGTVSVAIGSTKVDLGVKGGPGCPAVAIMPWTTPTTPGHYCLQVQLQPVDDSNPQNNLGQENTDVGTAHSPAVFTFTLRNDTDLAHTYTFMVDSYTPGAPDPCDSSGDPEEDRRARMARHERGSQSMPPGWHVTIEPEAPSLGPGESTAVTVTASPPDGLSGDQTLNVNAFHEYGLAGGVTLTVTVS